MTVERDTNWVRYQGDSLATEFPYTFRIPEMAMVRVYLQDVASGGLVRLLDSSEYSITGVARDNYNGGTVTYPLTGPLLDDTQYILIMRETSYRQELSIDNQAGFYPESVEYQLDKIVFQIQQLNTKTAGSISVAPGETPPDIYTVKQWYLDTGTAAQAAQESETYSHLWSSAPEDQSVNDGTRSGFSSFHWAKKAEQAAGGGVQSVGLSAPTGFDVSNSPITVNGDLAFTYSAGYEGFTTALKNKINGIEAGAQVNLSVGTTAGTVAAGDDGRFTDAREWSADTVSEVDAKAGTSTARKAWTSERVRQNVMAALGVPKVLVHSNNGTLTPIPVQGYGVTSIVNLETGQYQINFEKPFANTDYELFLTVASGSTVTTVRAADENSDMRTTSSAGFKVWAFSGTILNKINYSRMSIAAYGEQ